jgi:hypothetical protein
VRRHRLALRHSNFPVAEVEISFGLAVMVAVDLGPEVLPWTAAAAAAAQMHLLFPVPDPETDCLAVTPPFHNSAVVVAAAVVLLVAVFSSAGLFFHAAHNSMLPRWRCHRSHILHLVRFHTRLDR